MGLGIVFGKAVLGWAERNWAQKNKYLFILICIF